MVTNNEAVDNFLNGKRSLSALKFCQLIRETNNDNKHKQAVTNVNGDNLTMTNTSNISDESVTRNLSNLSIESSFSASNPISASAKVNDNLPADVTKKRHINGDEVAFNYAMVNLFTGCPRRASIIFTDLLKRYPRNPCLWLRLAESMLAAERARLSEFEHIQQLASPHSRDHLIKPKNKPILIKINPNYCPQQLLMQQHSQNPSNRLPANFLVTIRSYLQKSLDLINEYNDISLLNDDIPQKQKQTSSAHQQQSSMNEANTILLPSGSLIPKVVSQNDNSSRQSSKLSQRLSYSNPYKSISRSALYHLRNKVQLNLAYISLCMGEPVKALTYTTLCLKSSPQGYEKVMASLYHAEACILASRIDEAIQFLNLELLNMAKSLTLNHDLGPGDAKRVVYADDMQHQFDRGALATIITYNLSVAYAAKGEFDNAHKILMRCIRPTKPNPMQLTICLLYVQLQQGQVEAAKKTILSSLPQFR